METGGWYKVIEAQHNIYCKTKSPSLAPRWLDAIVNAKRSISTKRILCAQFAYPRLIDSYCDMLWCCASPVYFLPLNFFVCMLLIASPKYHRQNNVSHTCSTRARGTYVRVSLWIIARGVGGYAKDFSIRLAPCEYLSRNMYGRQDGAWIHPNPHKPSIG